MLRRQFTRRLTAALALPLLPAPAPALRRNKVPPRLKAGATVGLITPGSYIGESGLEKAVRQIEGLGLKVKLGKNVGAEYGFLAGTDAQRLEDIHGMFADRQVDAIWCARGGYGCGRLLPLLDYDLIKDNPKILIGYSDITALLNAITRETGLVTYHGPVGSSDFTEYTERQVRRALLEGEAYETIRPPVDAMAEGYVIRGGTAEGELWGGNLSLLAAAAGTGYTPPIKGSLLFMEDIGEKPYRIDRMLTQLRQAWDLEAAAGILLGIFNDCEADAGDRSLTLRETLTGRLGDLGIPVAYGFPIGHINNMCTLPVGARARVQMDRRELVIL